MSERGKILDMNIFLIYHKFLNNLKDSDLLLILSALILVESKILLSVRVL